MKLQKGLCPFKDTGPGETSSFLSTQVSNALGQSVEVRTLSGRLLPDANSNETLLRCIAALKDYFNINNWKINQPINVSQVYILLDKVDGVQTVPRPDYIRG